MESLNLEHLPASHTLHLALYKDVSNAAFLHEQLLARNPEFEYALVDASIVSSLPSLPFPAPAFPRRTSPPPQSHAKRHKTARLEEAGPRGGLQSCHRAAIRQFAYA